MTTHPRHLIHGKTGSPEYHSWQLMLRRCYDPHNPKYPSYGGRGIQVCERWKHSFAAFYEDMGDKPSKSYTIERKDNDGNYCPDNCIWATATTQARNRRSSSKVTIDGKTATQVEWAEISGISHKLISARLKKNWDPKKAVFTPSRNRY